MHDYERFVESLLAGGCRKRGDHFLRAAQIYRYLIKEDLTQYNLEKLEYCVVAGEPLNPEVYNQFLKMTGLRLMEGYGQTESVVMVATYPWMEPKPGSMGKPSPGFEMDIVDENGRSCEVGEVADRGRTDRRIPVGMFKGYYRDEELPRSGMTASTIRAIPPGVMRTVITGSWGAPTIS